MNLLVFFHSQRAISLGWLVSENPKGLEIEVAQDQRLVIKKERVVFQLKLEIKVSFDKLNKIKSEASELDLEEVWEVILSYGTQVTPEELLALIYSDYSDENLIKLIYCILTDNTYFTLKNGLIYPNERETVTQRKVERAKKQALVEEAYEIIQWLNFENHDIKPCHLKELISYVFDREYKTKLTDEVKNQLGVSQEAFRSKVMKALEQRGVITPLTNIPFLKAGIDLEPIEAIYSYEVLRTDNKISFSSEIISVDNPDTEDIDDAFCFEKTPSGYQIGIVITNVAPLFKSAEILKKLAKRPITLYMPDRNIHMLNEELATKELSLKASQPKNVFVISAHLNQDAKLISYNFEFGVTTISRNISYTEFDELLNREYRELHELCQKLRLIRVESGAVDFKRQESDLKVKNGEIKLTPIPKTPARVVIEELMILANYLVAKIFIENDLPGIYRGQTILSRSSLEDIMREKNESVRNFKLRSVFGKSEFSTQPLKHDSLGLPYYIQATSPIRRFFDLICQLQLWLHHNNQATLTTKELESYISLATPFLETFQSVQRDAKRYYTLRYLEFNKIKNLKGIVVSKNQGGYVVEIPDFDLFCYLKTAQGLDLGSEVRLQIEVINPEKLSILVSVG